MNKILEYILSFTKDRQDRVAVGAMTSGIVYIALVFHSCKLHTGMV